MKQIFESFYSFVNVRITRLVSNQSSIKNVLKKSCDAFKFHKISKFPSILFTVYEIRCLK